MLRKRFSYSLKKRQNINLIFLQCFKNQISVTYSVRVPLLDRLSIGPVLNRLGQWLNRRTAWVGWLWEKRMVQHPQPFLTKRATPSRANSNCLPFFFLDKMGFSMTQTLNTGLAKWPPLLNTRPNNLASLRWEEVYKTFNFSSYFPCGIK